LENLQRWLWDLSRSNDNKVGPSVFYFFMFIYLFLYMLQKH